MSEVPEAGGDRLRAAVAEVWRRAVGAEPAGDDDHFFLAGADSIVAVEAAMSLRSVTGTEVELDLLYEYPEFGRLVAALAGEGGAARAGRPLTAAEERLWASEQLWPGTARYHVGAVYRFAGRLDVAGLRAALDGLAAAHPALRRGFAAPGLAVEADPARVRVPCRWVAAPGVSEAELGALLDREVREPFELARPPLLRALVVDRGAAGDVLLLTVHHLVCDGASLTLLEEELGRRCAGADDAGAPGAPPVVPSGGAVVDGPAALAYWRRRLAGAPQAMALPADLPRPAVLGTGGAVHRAAFAPRALAALRAVAGQERLSPFMTWLAAYAVGLAAVTGDRDLVVAVPASAREPGGGAEIGMFVDTLPLRLTLPPRVTAREVARRVRRAVAEALAHRRAPLQDILAGLRIGADRSRAPLAQVALTHRMAGEGGLRLAGRWARRELWPTGTAKYELLWSVVDGAEPELELEYHTELFSPAAAGALHERLIGAAAAAFAAPDAPLPEVVREPSRGGDGPGYEAVHQRFERHAVRRPGAAALVDGALRLTYGELAVRARAVAAGLRAAGLGRGSVVAVVAERGAGSVTGFLGALYAGCGYLPVDPGQPAARAVRLLGAADAVLVARAAVDAVPGAAGGGPVLVLEELWDRPVGPGAPGPAAVTGADVAYVMFTSGSTGEPKAVVVPHRAISRLVPDTDYLRIGPEDRVAHLSHPAFDAATFEVWGALAAGATLVVGGRDVALAPARLREFVAGERISVLWLTATLFHQVVDFAPDALAPLRVLLAGGEQLDARRLAALLARPDRPGRVVNGYGPTENTTFSTWHDITPADAAAGTVPIGRPVSGTTAHVLDGAGAPVPVGAVGELVVGGDGLAHGYLGDPAATAAAFVPDPFDPRGGRRLYRTGDLVRVLPGGLLAFEGRRDDQVKIRGHRVEPAEVERELCALPGVGRAVVLARPTEHGAELVAWVTPVPGGGAGALDGAALAAALRERLPDPLVPLVVPLERLPVNASGKTDRAALLAGAGPSVASPPEAPPAPEPADPAAGSGDALAGRIAALWCEVLQVPAVGPGDSFLALGGHSIMALRLLARLDEEFAVTVELVDFFADPTPAGLTALVRGAGVGDVLAD
ncbi:amino acid adenylation domain-containing protein [Streptomyces harbinensis]|uniref:non-ribosomal peptide synthetase n=1 Tax=Streptomyces harbinensis TaxID=1176198 RepID=UPI00159284B6|nr:non-ribosomal peptide synthetase [Streptomyces harbinensis]QKV67377.1 amino acid adenylation domain-containing protein [Streptomyces harbinensis]